MTPAEAHAEALQNLRDKLLVASTEYVRLLDAEGLDGQTLALSAQRYHRALARYVAHTLENPDAQV